VPHRPARPDLSRPAFDRAELDPRAAYPCGTRLGDLRTAEALLVVALRLWTARRLAAPPSRVSASSGTQRLSTAWKT